MSDKWEDFLSELPSQVRPVFADYEIDHERRLTIYLVPGTNKVAIEKRLGGSILIAVKITFDDIHEYILEVDTPYYEPVINTDVSGQAYFDQMMFNDRASEGRISYRKDFVDLTGDVISAIVLTDLIYLHQPNKRNKRRFNAYSKGDIGWIARTLDQWSEKTRLTKRQIQYSIDKMVKQDIVIRENHRYMGLRTMHLRINEPVFGQKIKTLHLDIT